MTCRFNLHHCTRYGGYLALLVSGVALTLILGSPLSLSQQWQLVIHHTPQDFPDYQYVYSTLPRLCLALIIGALLGLSGSLLQQMTQNPLASPMTLGIASGAWLALILASLCLPGLLAQHSAWVAMAGATVASGFIWAIAGRQDMRGLPIILAGIAVHILCGTLASTLILLNEQIAKPLFIWGAGDLTQTGWHWVRWLLPKLLIVPLVILLAPRALTLLRLGDSNASARGMALWPTLSILYFAVLWLVGSAIAAVGVIGFISLLAPNMARLLGSRSARDELFASLILGALLLVITDLLAIVASRWSVNIIPSGTTATLIGAPVLIILLRRRLHAGDHNSLAMPQPLLLLSKRLWGILILALPILGLLALMLSPVQTGDSTGFDWQLTWPNDTLLNLRWPAMLAAMAAGAGMALAGVILQRLIRNPLASPDILGLTAGASMALVLSALFFETSIHAINPLIAALGSMATLALLIFLGRRHHFSPSSLILTGISLTAAIEGITQWILAQGNDNVYSIISWMVGSSYHVSAEESLWLLFSITLLGGLALCSYRWLTLLSAGDSTALALGLPVNFARLSLLVLATALVASVAAVFGPLAFMGLIAPHIAAMLGAQKPLQQLLLATLVAAQLMLIADWLGRTLFYPNQLPTGIIAAVIGSLYFVFLMTRSKN